MGTTPSPIPSPSGSPQHSLHPGDPNDGGSTSNNPSGAPQQDDETVPLDAVVIDDGSGPEPVLADSLRTSNHHEVDSQAEHRNEEVLSGAQADCDSREENGDTWRFRPGYREGLLAILREFAEYIERSAGNFSFALSNTKRYSLEKIRSDPGDLDWARNVLRVIKTRDDDHDKEVPLIQGATSHPIINNIIRDLNGTDNRPILVQAQPEVQQRGKAWFWHAIYQTAKSMFTQTTTAQVRDVRSRSSTIDYILPAAFPAIVYDFGPGSLSNIFHSTVGSTENCQSFTPHATVFGTLVENS